MQNPKLIPVPFANSGIKDDIPKVKSTSMSDDKASWETGFPEATMLPVYAGGLPPDGKDFNGVLNQISENLVFQSKGGRYKFDPDFALSIGGYPKGATLQTNDESAEYQSLIDNNLVNFNTATPEEISQTWRITGLGDAIEVLDGKFDKASVKNEMGLSQTEVVSQRVVTEMGSGVVGSFENGLNFINALTNSDQLVTLENEFGKQTYCWTGDLPKQVPSGSTPQSTGGIGKGAWVSVGDASLRSDLRKKFSSIFFASDFGAVDGGNNTAAFQRLAAACNAKKSHFRVIFDVAEAEIFDEVVNANPSENERYYQSAGDIFSLINCSDFELDFTGCKMTTKKGLHYGSFHPLTGERYDAVGYFTNPAYAASIGAVVNLENCKRYVGVNFFASGSNDSLNIGGRWGDKGIQLKHIGIREFNCSNAVWQNRTCSYFGLDGTYIGGSSSVDSGGITVINEVCEYNGRQGFSFTGGRGVVFINPRWCYTGMGAIYSPPGSGIDIEPNAGFMAKSLKIINPCIVGNRGAGVLALGGDEQTTNIVISGGEIVSTSPGSAFYVNTPKVRMNIHDTDIHGSIRIATAKLTFRDCFISTLMKYNIQPSGKLMENIGEDAKFVNCKILTTYLDALFITDGLFDSCDIEFAVDAPPKRSRASVIGGKAILKDTKIHSTYTNPPEDIDSVGERTYIDVTGYTEGKTYIGTTSLSGVGLALGGRSGNTNIDLGSVNKGGIYLYDLGEKVEISSNLQDETFITDIPLGVGTFMITVHSFSSKAKLSFCICQLSYKSGEPLNHGTMILNKVTYGSSVTSSSIVIVDGQDVLRLVSTLDLSGVCTVSRLATSSRPERHSL